MLLTEDEYLDIERVRQLSEEKFEKEMEDWGDDEALEWESRKGKYHLTSFSRSTIG